MACSFRSTRLATVDLPAPESPVNHSTQGRWNFACARLCLFTSSACQCRLAALRKAKRNMPAATVAFENRSNNMNDAGNPRRRPGAGHHDILAGAGDPAGNGSGITAERGIRTIDPLHGKSKRVGSAAVIHVDLLEMFKQGRAGIPGRIRALYGEVV